MPRSEYIYVVASSSKSDEIYGVFTVKWEAVRFMKRDYEEGEDWREGYCLLRTRDGQEYDPEDIDLTTIE